MKTKKEFTQASTPAQKLLADLERLSNESEEIVRLVSQMMDIADPAKCPRCAKITNYNRELSVAETVKARRDEGLEGVKLVASICPSCATIAKAKARTSCVIQRGVPRNLAEFDWNSWTENDQWDRVAASVAKSKRPNSGGSRSVVYIHGKVGTGKSSLAVLIAKGWTNSFLWINQVALMMEIRRQYGDRKAAIHPVEKYAKPSLLVLDEFGLMSGGRDETSGIYHLINERIANQKMTVITSNSKPQDLKEAMGEPTIDRILSAAQVVELKGKKR